MSEKMTLEQVRDWHKGRADGIRQGITTGSASVHDRLADAIVTHLATLPSAVPDGWKLVPIEPTEEMLEQAATHDLNRRTAETDQWNHDTWSFMLDAAPEPPNACREAMLTQRGNAQDAVALFIGQRVMWEDNLGRSHPATIVDSHPETYDARLDDGTYANGYSRKRFAIDAHLASLPAATPGDIVERLRTAARALVRERVVYAEDVEALADVAKLLEAMLTQRGDAQDARDVARYRWLRANAYECDERLSFNNMYLECADGKLLLDKSIDAAMLASGEG